MSLAVLNRYWPGMEYETGSKPLCSDCDGDGYWPFTRPDGEFVEAYRGPCASCGGKGWDRRDE